MDLQSGPLGFFLKGRKAKSAPGPAAQKKKKVLSGETIVCLSLQEQEVKLAVLSTDFAGKAQIEQFFSVGHQGLSDEDIASRLRSLIADLHLNNPRVIGVISSGAAVTRNIEIPSRDPEEIREILGLQASRHTPYARDEIIIDYIDLGVFKSVYTKVLFIIVPRVVVARYYSIASFLKMQVEKVVFVSEAMARFFWKHLNLLTERLPVCVLNIDATASEFLIMFKGAALFVRSIPVGAKHFEGAKEGYMTRFIEELRKSFDTYQGEKIDLMPSQIVLGGAVQGLDDLTPTIQDAFNMSVRQVLDADVVPMTQGFREKCAGSNWALLPASVPGILADELAVDLSPEESKFKRFLAERSKQMVKVGILAMVLLGLLCFSIVNRIYFKTVRIQQLKTRYAPIEKEAKALEAVYARVRSVKSHLAMCGKSLDSLAEISSLTSDDLYLNEIKFEAGKKMSVKGTAYNKQAVFALLDKMKESKIFKNVETKYITGRVDNGQDVSDFELVASVP